MTLVVAHYPTHCSKWNPIEHKMFCHISRAWDGVVFENIQIVKELAQNASTQTGLNVKVWINSKNYQTKRKATPDFIDHLNQFVQFSPILPKWNYLLKPKKL